MLSDRFPRYRDFDPLVPVWCATPDRAGCMHRFFDTSPISPSGRYLAVFQMPFEDRQPVAGDVGQVVVVDLESGRDWVVAQTCGWEPQLGANINWGGTDRELYFNDVDVSSWRPFAWKADPLSGRMARLDGTVYHASLDGRWLVSANMTTMRKTQPGYGVQVPSDIPPYHVGAAQDDGVYLTDTATGKTRLIASIKRMLTEADPAVTIGDASQYEIYGFHSKFNPQGTRIMASLRWFPATGEPQWNLFGTRGDLVRFAWITMDIEGGNMCCAVGPEQWEKGGHHATWFPDGKRISMNLNIDRDGLRFVQVNDDGSDLHKILDKAIGSGHPTIHPDGRHLLTDTYSDDATAYGDGTVPLRWIDLETGVEKALIRVNAHTPWQSSDSVLRVDPHPAWDRTWRYVAFNGFVDGSRRVFIADMASVIG